MPPANGWNMKAIKLFVFAVTVVASGADLRAQSASPTPAPAQIGGGAVPSGGMPSGAMPSGAMPSYENGGGQMMGQMMNDPSYGGGCGPNGCGPNGYCGDGNCGDCGGCRLGCGCFCNWWNRCRMCTCCGRAYLQIDAMMLNRGTGYSQPLATDGFGGATVLNAHDPWFGFETLPRITMGYVLPNDTAVEGSYFYKDDMNAMAGVNSPGETLVIPDPTGTIVNSFGNAQVNLSTSIQNAEINLVETGRWFNYLAGFRYVELQDHFRLNAYNSTGNFFQGNTDTYNSLLGGQMGLRSGFNYGLFRLEGTGKAGLFYNQSKSHALINNDGVVTGTNSTSGQCESFVGELNCSLTYRPTAALAFRAGYQIYWLTQVALAQSQFISANPVGASGNYLNDRGDLILHGPSAGVDLRW